MTSDLTLRPISGPDELDLFNTLPYVLNAQVADDLEAGRRRPEWLWLALRDGRVTARAGWWSRPGDPHPLVFDILDVDGDPDDAVRLIAAAQPAVTPPGADPAEYIRFLPPEEPDPAADDAPWRTALTTAGAKLFVERLRLHWEPGTPIAPTRLSYRPPDSAEELIDLMIRVLDGTLDAHSRADLTRMSAREAAAEQYREELERYTSPHDWWRIGTLPDGEPVGFVIPAHNGYNPIIAYIGVVPEHRGRGHVDDLLAAGTRVLSDEGVPRIRASTDVGNTPMAAAFARAGYVVFERQIDMVWR